MFEFCCSLIWFFFIKNLSSWSILVATSVHENWVVMTLYIFSFWEAVLIVKWPWQPFPIQESFCPSSSLQQGFALFTFFCPSLQTSFSMAFYERNLANEERFFCLPSYYAICFPFFSLQSTSHAFPILHCFDFFLLFNCRY